MKRRVAARLPQTADGVKLLDYLCCRFAYHDRTEWQEKIQRGEIALDENICREPLTVLHKNMLMEYFPASLIEPEVNRNYRIIYEDDHLLVIDKPGNLPVHPAGPYFANTLWALLADTNYGKVHIVNRLDRETSGLLIAAKTGRTAGEISKNFGTMEKCYTVLVHGVFSDSFNASGWLLPDEDSPVKKKQKFVFSASECSDAVAVETLFTPLQSNEKYTLLSARLRTGRMHQIRATLHGLGFPVVGDKLYGLNEEFYRRFAQDTLTPADWQTLVLPRQALHCCKLSFEHPSSGEVLTFTSDPPGEITALLH